MISVRTKFEDALRGLSELDKKCVPVAAQQALNRVAPTVKTRTVREVQQRLALRRQGGIRALITVSKASKGDLTARVVTADSSIKMDETRNAVVKVTRKRVNVNGKSRVQKVTTVLFKGKTLDGAIQIELGAKRTIRKKEKGRYGTGQRSQRVAPVWAYSALQELIKGEIDKIQETLGIERFEIEFDRALANQIARNRM